MNSIELGCLSCSKYSLIAPIHGRGDAPYYRCIDNKDPRECEACKRNTNKVCVKGENDGKEP